MDVGSRTRSARESIGFTQDRAADKIGVSRQTISNWENGRALPDIVSVVRMSDLYQTSLDELLKGDPAMTKKLERDERAKTLNRRLIYTMGGIGFVIALFYLVCVLVGGAAEEFCQDAMSGFVIGFCLVCCIAFYQASRE